MLRQLARIGKPLVAVVYTGRPLELGEVMDLADAVLVVWHPGVEAGNALASVVFGDTSPHGRLPMTFPLTTGHIPTSTHQRPTGRPLVAARTAASAATSTTWCFPACQPRATTPRSTTARRALVG